MKAFFDESHDSTCSRFLAFGGFYSAEAEWDKFEKAWREALERHSLQDFHMVDCEQGRESFEGISRPDRAILQNEFIAIINAHRLRGIACGLQLTRYIELSNEFKRVRAIPKGGAVSGSLGDPYFLGFELAIHCLLEDAIANGLPAGEKVDLVFDQNGKYSGRASRVHESMANCQTLPFVHALGTITFGARQEFAPLQAADILAYEFFREIDWPPGVEKKQHRYQWDQVCQKVPGWHVIPDEKIREVLSMAPRNQMAS